MSDFLDAVKRGDSATVARMLDADHSLLQAKENGVSAALLALYHGHGEIARLLVSRGAPLGFADACALGDLDAVRRMLGSDPSLLQAMTPDGFPAWALSIFFRQPAVARFLIEQGADVRRHAENRQRVAPVHAAAAACDRETMRLLLERGADPNARQESDYAPIHTAGARGDIEMAKLLLEHGAERLPRGSDGKTPVDIAREHGQQAFVDWIEKSAT
jgi:ankyrin repeat protein